MEWGTCSLCTLLMSKRRNKHCQIPCCSMDWTTISHQSHCCHRPYCQCSFQWWQVFLLSCVHHRSCLVLMSHAYLSDHTHHVFFKVAHFKICCPTKFWDPTFSVAMINFTFSYHNLFTVSCVPSCGMRSIPAFTKVFQLVQRLFQRTYAWMWWTALWLPGPSLELPTRKIKAAWE
jgi:hypothetical protein